MALCAQILFVAFCDVQESYVYSAVKTTQACMQIYLQPLLKYQPMFLVRAMAKTHTVIAIIFFGAACLFSKISICTAYEQ